MLTWQASMTWSSIIKTIADNHIVGEDAGRVIHVAHRAVAQLTGHGVHLDELASQVAAIAADGEREFARERKCAEILLIDFQVIDGEFTLVALLDTFVGDAVLDLDAIDGDVREALYAFRRHVCYRMVLYFT
jgi:hypothetical protein